MIYNDIYKNCRPTILMAILFFSISQNFLLAQTKSVEAKGYDKASYNASQVGKFIKTWLVAGPVPVSNDTLEPTDSLQEKVFQTDIISGVNVVPNKPVPPVLIKEKNFNWQLISLEGDIIDLDTFYKGKDFVYAYALAEIKAPTSQNVMLGVGSDDGIKVWLNGKLVHDNWIPRGVNKDDDLIPLKLVKGSNQVLLGRKKPYCSINACCIKKR